MEKEEPLGLLRAKDRNGRIVTREQILAGCVCFILMKDMRPRDSENWEDYGALKSRASAMMGMDGARPVNELIEELLDMFEDDHLRIQGIAPVKAKIGGEKP